MANDIILNTRIKLKYDSYSEWSRINPALLEGEVAIAKLTTTNAVAPSADDNQAPVLFKVGPGNFNDLPWVSALAADVYAWAKQTEAEFKAWVKGLVPVEVIDNGTGKFITDVTATSDVNGHHITITRADAVNSLAATDDDVVILTADKSTGDVTVDAKHAKKGQTGGYTGGQATAELAEAGQSMTIKVPKLVADEYGHVNSAEDVEYKITLPEAVVDNDTITTVIGKDVITVTSNGEADPTYTVALNVDADQFICEPGSEDEDAVLRLKIHDINEGIHLAQNGDGFYVDGADQALADILQEAKDYADENDTNTAHTHSAGAGLTVTGNGDISGNVEYSANIDVKYEGSKIYLVDKTSGETIGDGFDASKFVEDSYLEEVTYSDADGDNVLTFTFKLNDGTSKTVDVDLSHLVDVYVADEGSLTKTNSQFSIKDGGVSTDKIADKAVTEAKLEQNVQDALALARTAIQSHQDISDKKDKQTAVVDQNLSEAKVIKGIAQNENGEITVSTRDLTPADIGAQPAGNYKTTQEIKSFTGAATKTVTSVAQNANGEVEVTYGDIAFPVGSGEIAIATAENGVVKLNGSIMLNDHTLEDGAAEDITLAKIATTGNIEDLVQNENTYIIFDCGSATKNI